MENPTRLLTAYGQDRSTVGIGMEKGIADSNNGVRPDMVLLDLLRSSQQTSIIIGECTIKVPGPIAVLHGISAEDFVGGESKYKSNLEAGLDSAGLTNMTVLGITFSTPEETQELSDGATTPEPDPATNTKLWVQGELEFNAVGVSKEQTQVAITDALATELKVETSALRVSILAGNRRRLLEEFAPRRLTSGSWVCIFEMLMEPTAAVDFLVSARTSATETDSFTADVVTRLKALGAENPTVSSLSMPSLSALPTRNGSCSTNFCPPNTVKRNLAPEELCSWLSCAEARATCCDELPSTTPKPGIGATTSGAAIGGIIAAVIIVVIILGVILYFFRNRFSWGVAGKSHRAMAVYEESNLQEPGSPADKFGSSQGPGYGQDPLGTYQVVDAAVIKSELDLNSEKIGEFQAGELVEVVHIVDLGPVAARVRAHVVDQSRVPIGWISLRNTESGKQWAVHYTGDSAGHHHEGMHGELLHNYDTFNAFPASPPLQVGDWVEWKESDSFVPRGAVGQVLAVQEEEDKVRVRFPQATLFLHPGDTMFVAHENDLHRGVLDSLQGEWRIFEGTTRYPGVMEIRAGGCVIHTDGNHYPQQDLIILNGAIARNDGWSVDMANSTKRELMWFKADSMHSWRKVKALSEYEVGDRVEWTEEANEVPRGTQGVVEQVFDSYCRTKFPGATWDLLPNELLSQGDEPPASPLPQLMSPMGGSAGSLAAAAGGQQTSSPQSQTAKDAAQGLHFEGEDEHQVHPTADYGHQRDDNHRGQRPPPLDTDLGTPMGSTTPAVSLAQAAAASAATAAAAAAVVSGTSPGHSNGEGALHQQVSGQPVSTGDHEHRTVSPGPLTQGTGTTAATPGAATVTTPTEMNTMMYYPPGRNEALLYKLEVDSSQVGSPAHTPTSPPSTNTPPVSPAQLHSGMPPSPGTMGSARHSGPKMSPVREPTNTSSPAGSQAGTQVSAQQSPREKALALATAGAAAGATAAAVAEAETTGKSQGLHQLMFKAATAPISSAKSALSEGIRSARGPSGPKGGGPSDPKGVMSDRRLFTEAADFNDMPEPPPPTPSAETAARGRRVDQSSPKSGSSGKATPKSGASQGSARPNEAGPPKGDTLLDRSKPRRPQTPGTPNRRQFRV